MPLRGYIERYDGKQVSGWALDTDAAGPVVVSLRVDDVELLAARADRARPDLAKPFGKDVGGFHLRIGPVLASLLPDGAKLTVLVNGMQPIPPRPGVPDRVSNPGCDTVSKLRQRLADGWKISPKSGELYRPLATLESTEGLLNAFEYCQGVLKRELGFDLLLAYGTLLGAVREGDFIGHDDDIDGIFYVKTASTLEACAEFARIVARLTEVGEKVRVVRSGQFHWFTPRGHAVDIFMGWFDEGLLYSYCAGGVPLAPEAVAATPFTFKGRSVLVPAAHEKILEATYGPGWRVPDPLFQWHVDKGVAAQMATLQAAWEKQQNESAPPGPLGEEIPSPAVELDPPEEHWNHFYKTFNFTVPSQFAALVATELQTEHALLELGCGNGRDALFFAGLGHTVLALDQSAEAVTRNRERGEKFGLSRLRFHCGQAGDPAVVSAAVARLAETAGGKPLAVYARFFFHAIHAETERIILQDLGQSLPPGSRCFFEFRCTEDAATPKVFGDHYRRYIDLASFVAECEKAGLERVYTVSGQGLAKFREEDPWVARVIVARAGAAER